jgi:ribosomal protein S18 acetylase RimI-like enzyme
MMTKPAETRLPVLHWRTTPRSGDTRSVRKLIQASGVFSPEEIDVAEELVRERLDKGTASGYEFVFAETGESLAGSACYGRVPLTRASYDLDWIAVGPNQQRRGVGQQLLARVEDDLRARGGGNLYVETSSRPSYEAARRFYASAGYRECARFPDFYAPGDAKVVFLKRFP